MLPSSFTEESRVRYEIAQQLCNSCPVEMGKEIALTGSVSRGTADKNSDIELNLWVNHIPDRETRRSWLMSIGCEGMVLDREESIDGTVWGHFYFQGFLVEIGWQVIDAIDRELQAFLRGDVTDHRKLVKAWVLENALPLRSGGEIESWKKRLQYYPDVLQRALISDALHEWNHPHILNSRWSLVQRGERFSVIQQVSADLQRVFRILFAINRRWEPDWKWFKFVTRDLLHVPASFQNRVESILIEDDLYIKVRNTLELVADTLVLASMKYDVSEAEENVRTSLNAHSAI